MLREHYANPEKELVRLRDRGRLLQIAHGTYVVKPDTTRQPDIWKPTPEAAAMAYAVGAFGPDAPVLYGISAARQWHAIPRAINLVVVAVPAKHRPVKLATGPRVVFVVRDTTMLDTTAVPTELGPVRVTTKAQTIADLVAYPELGGMGYDAGMAVACLAPQVDRGALDALPMTDARRKRLNKALDKFGCAA